MAARLLLKRLPRNCCEQKTFFVKILKSGAPILIRIKPVNLRTRHSLHCNGLCTSRLYSTSNVPSDSGISDPEMFRETPSFPPEWTDPSVTLEASTPTVADIVSEVPEIVTSTVGGYSPVGLLQTALEFSHTSLHMPWWIAIASATVLIRLAIFPLAVNMQVNAAKIANINPQAQQLHTQLMHAKTAGDKKTEAELGMKILTLYQDNNCHPLKMFMMPLAQLPVFISFLMALRGMAQLPVESMKTGGILWFQNLTVPDPTFALPLIACAAFLCNIELGGEGGGDTSNDTYKRMKLFMRASAFLILPVSVTFPSALFCYWVTNSLISMVQILIFKIPGVKTSLGIPKINKRP